MVEDIIHEIFNLQCPTEGLKEFVTTDGLPFVHFVLKKSSNGQPDTVVKFLHNVPDIDLLGSIKDRDGHTASQLFPDEAHKVLCAACRQGSVTVVKLMLDVGAEIDKFDDNALSPLMWAAKHGHIDIIKKLIERKASLNHCNINNENSLLTACKSNQWGAARELFDCGVDALCLDNEQKDAVSVALASHAVYLLQHMAAKNDEILTNLREILSLPDVCNFGYGKLITFYDTDSLSTQEIHTLLYSACSHKQIQIIQHLSEKIDDQSLIKFITHTYKAEHYDCMNVLVQSAQNRSAHLSYPDILLSETCKRPQCLNLTKYLIESDHNVDEGDGEPLRMAVKSNNNAAVHCLLAANAKPDKAEKNGFTPLLQASQNKNLEIVNVLLEWGADVNFSGEETPLTMACKGGSIELVNRFLSNKPAPDLNKANSKGLAPFEVAVDNNNPVVAIALLGSGASPVFKHMSFQKLCQIGRLDLVNTFLQSCTTNQITDSVFLDIPVQRGYVKLVNVILKSSNVTKISETLIQALKTACTLGTLDILKVLIQYDEGKFWHSVNNDPIYLQLALEHQHADIVDTLIDHGCELLFENMPWEDVIHSKEILDLLMKHDHDISQTSLNEALMAACRSDDKNAEYAVCVLLDREKSADVDHCDPDHVTPLLIVCQKSSVSLVKKLLNKGANPNHCDSNNKTPLFTVTELENMEITSCLIHDGKADPNFLSTPVDKNPLWEACIKGHLDIALLLLQNEIKPANPELRDEEGQHLLLKAHSIGQHEIVRLMLECQADPLTLSGVTLRQACQYGYAEYALQVYHNSNFNELIECFNLASKYDCPETALGIMIDIQDPTRQIDCFAKWRVNHKHY